MSAANLPPVFKPLKAFLQRAEELDRDSTTETSKVVAYYCRQYAMERGLELRSQDPTNQANEFLVSLMNHLEADKTKLETPPTKEMGQEIVTKFACDVFDKADSEDRAGFADKNTARGFYAASIFFDILRQFGEYETTVDTKRKYSKWKSAEIVKAIKEGRPIVPGGPDGVMPDQMDPPTNNEQPLPSGVNPVGGGVDNSAPFQQPLAPQQPQAPPAASSLPSLNPSPSSPPPSAPPPATGTSYNPGYTPPIVSNVPQHIHNPSNAAANFVPNSSYNGGGLVSDVNKVDDAIEFSHYAIRFLETRDVNSGIQYLEQAIALLKSPR
jgi:vacuolar protein sorting-associated protein VTA1